MFSPLAFPAGMIVYELTTSLSPPSHLALAPFELYRESLIILAIADGSELDHVSHKDDNGNETNGYDVQEHIRQLRALDQELESVRDQHPKALVHQALLFDYHHQNDSPELPDGLVPVPSSEKSKITTMKTIMCDLSSLFLAELTAMAKSFQGMSTIESPGVHLGKRQSEGYSWENGSPARPMSQYDSQSIDSRTGSPVPIPKADKSAMRMSMPVRFGQQHGEHTRTASSGSRPSTPQSSSGNPGQGFENNKSPPPLRRGEGVGSPERVSVQGFGSGSLSERARTKGKGRVSIAIGGLYLQAGRCQDAIRELSEGAYIAKSNNDHLWHAKALEGMLVSMLMLAWVGLDFTVPPLCYTSGTGPYQAPTANNAEQNGISNRLASLRNLSLLLPELLDRILALYERAANFAGESLPQLPFSETVIRYAKLLSTVHMCDGILNDSGLQLLVMGRPSSPMPNRHIPRLNITPARSDIVKTLFRAFPQPSATALLTVTDRTIILAGIASVLGVLGYDRKKAMIVRELISVLIPGLVQARMAGAAEMGIHPAAGLAALSTLNGNRNGAGALDLGEGDVESGVDDLLALLGRTYGAVSFQPSLLDENKKAKKKEIDDTDEAVVARILDNASSRQFGGIAVKMNVLRACINLAEALPDFEGVLRFSADLLRTAGTGVAPGPYTDDAGPMMEREEQVRLSTNIARTVDAAKKIGLYELKAEYWDEFLIRGVELDALPTSKAPTVHQSSVLASSVSGAETSKNPFIYNPFAKKTDAVIERVLVAGESAIFKVTLQNPYEFDIYIDRICLQADNDDFVGDVQKTVIGPYRNQILSVSGTPKAAGAFKITGCLVKIRGCRERRFPIFSQAWAPQSDIKIKAIGLGVQRLRPKKPVLDEKSAKKAKSNTHAPKPTNLPLTSIGHQPILQILSTSLSQLACMVLEGERQTFTITLKNLSKSTPVDLLLFSFQDSTQAAVQHVLSNRDASPAELYEYELILAQKPALRYLKDEDEEMFIEPSGTKVCKFEILGKPGLTNASVLVDYAHLGQPVGEIKDKFYTRQVSLPITVTVNASVELARLDVLPFSGSVPTSLWPSASNEAPAVQDEEEDDHVLITLDLRNAWPSPLKIHLELPNEITIEDDILPGTISRIVFPHKRIFLSDPHKPIPVLDPARQRQFVVSTARGGAEGEKAMRETFWYREELLRGIKATWSSTGSSWGTKRSGSVDLRGLRMVPRLIEALRIEDVSITLRIEKPISVSHGKAVVEVDEFMAIVATIKNRSDKPIHPLLRLQPSLRHHNFSHALDLSKKLLFTGVLQHPLPILAPHSSTEVKHVAIPLCRGEYEISACVEEAKLTQDAKDRMSRGQYGDGKRVGRERAGTLEIREMDRNLGGRERRVWYVREGLVVVVRVGDSDSGAED